MKGTLVKPLALTTSLLSVPLLGSILVFGPSATSTADLSALPSASRGFAGEAGAAAASPETSAGAMAPLVHDAGAAASREAMHVMPRLRLPEPPRVLATGGANNEALERLLERAEREVQLYRVGDTRRFLPGHRSSPAASDWTPSQAEVQRSLEQQAEEAKGREARIKAVLAQVDIQSAAELAERVELAYAEGAPELADALHTQSDLLISFDEAPVSLELKSHFRRRSSGGGDLELTLVRSEELGRPLVVSFPPGTYGEGLARSTEPRSSYRSFPRAQDLAFLRAPVVAFRPGQSRATVMVPVACASYGVKSPQADHPYALTRFERGSDVEKLMVSICAGEEKDDAQAQLAVWIARNDIDRGEFLQRAYRLRTFHEHRPLGTHDIRGAARLLMQGGVDPHRTQFFPRPAASPAPEPTPREPREDPAPGSSPASAEPAPAPEPRLPAGAIS